LSLREQPVSEKPDHYTEVGPADFLAALRKAGNALAGYESRTFPARGARFPPGTTMTLGDRSLTLSNRFGSLQFTLSAASGGVSVIPLTNKASPILPDGKPQFETDLLGIRIVNRQTALYSQHRDAAKQAAWRKRVISGLRSWFEPRPSRVDRIEDKAFWGE